MKNTRKTTLVILSLFILLLTSCRAKKVVSSDTIINSDKQFERIEIITKQNPYEITLKEDIVIDKGIVKPVKIEIKHNKAKGVVSIKDNILTYTVQNKDTLITSREITEKDIINTESTKTTTISEEKPTTLWGKFKKFGRKVFLWSIFLNIAFISVYVIKITRRVYMPL